MFRNVTPCHSCNDPCASFFKVDLTSWTARYKRRRQRHLSKHRKYLPENFRRNLTFNNAAVRTSNSASCRPAGSSVTTWWVTGAPFPSAQASRYGLDGPGIEYQWGRDFPNPSRPVLGVHRASCTVKWVPGLFHCGKAVGLWRWLPTPIKRRW